MAEIFVGVHAMLARLTGVKEFSIEQSEAEEFLEAAGKVASFYPHIVKKFAPKTLAWLNLAMVGGTIYGTRIMAYNIRTAQERAAKPSPPLPVAVGRDADRPANPAVNGANAAPKPAGPTFTTVETPEGPVRIPIG